MDYSRYKTAIIIRFIQQIMDYTVPEKTPIELQKLLVLKLNEMRVRNGFKTGLTILSPPNSRHTF